VLERGRIRANRAREVAMVAVAVATRGDEHAGTRLPQHEDELALAMDREHRMHDRAEPCDSEVRGHGLVPIRELHRDDVARLDAERGQTGGHPLGPCDELAEPEPDVAVDHRRPRREARRRRLGDVRQRLASPETALAIRITKDGNVRRSDHRRRARPP
jgi:hypothetical protein